MNINKEKNWSGQVLRKPFEWLRQSGSKARCFFPCDFSEGEQLRFLPSDGRLDSIEAPCLPFSGLRPATEGTHPLGSPNRFVASHKSAEPARFKASLSSPFGRGTVPAQPSNGFLNTQANLFEIGDKGDECTNSC